MAKTVRSQESSVRGATLRFWTQTTILSVGAMGKAVVKKLLVTKSKSLLVSDWLCP